MRKAGLAPGVSALSFIKGTRLEQLKESVRDGAARTPDTLALEEQRNPGVRQIGNLGSLSGRGCFGELNSGGYPSTPQPEVRKDPGPPFFLSINLQPVPPIGQD